MPFVLSVLHKVSLRDEYEPISLLQLDALATSPGTINVIIDTTKGSRNKYAYDMSRRVLFLKSLLPLETVFPFDFGFISSTIGGDSDPLNALVLMEEEAVVGCLIEVRLIGVIEAEQTKDGKTVRNDPLITAAVHSVAYHEIQSIEQLGRRMLDEIEHFFSSYNAMSERIPCNRPFRPGSSSVKRGKRNTKFSWR